jgi:hypothetical protein
MQATNIQTVDERSLCGQNVVLRRSSDVHTCVMPFVTFPGTFADADVSFGRSDPGRLNGERAVVAAVAGRVSATMATVERRFQVITR